VSTQNGPTLRGSLSRAAAEWRYLTQSRWSLADVGEFWDSVTSYDDINEGTYSYFRRFTNSYQLAADLVSHDNVTVDVQTRTGYGTLFWAERGYVGEAHLVDFSERMLEMAACRLARAGLPFELHLVNSFPLPFPNESFDLVLCYETVEHICQRAVFVSELARILKPLQWMILTCPNVLWEPAHSLAAILNVHHSEGPHRFPRRSSLISLFDSCGLRVVRENSTIILPFSSDLSGSTDRLLEHILPETLRRFVALRRCFVLQKIAH
jgi:SAM-dependent methyltransferase